MEVVVKADIQELHNQSNKDIILAIRIILVHLCRTTSFDFMYIKLIWTIIYDIVIKKFPMSTIFIAFHLTTLESIVTHLLILKPNGH